MWFFFAIFMFLLLVRSKLSVGAMRLCCVGVLVLVCILDTVSARYASCNTPTIKYGRIRSRQRGRTLKFLCNPDYQLAGERTAFCVNGTWDVPIPKCVRPTCSKMDDAPKDGLVLPSYGGAVLNFYCQPNFELNGATAIYCDGFKWDNQKPSCLPSNTKPKLFCDFETEDMCRWNHDLNHDMDWVRDSYKTPSGYSMDTGPSFDHTLGEGASGHYMYLESSSRRINDTARLISPIFGNPNSDVCLEFWYHMFGRTTGTLRAYIKKLSDPWPLNPVNAVFSKSGSQGNVWYRALIDLGRVNSDFQVIMEGVRGPGYLSDIAIDDVNIIPNCTYEDHIPSTTESSPSVFVFLPTVESCKDRCGLRRFGNESADQIIACDCDEDCFQESRCCPDFIDVCISGTLTDLDSSTTESNVPAEIDLGTTKEILMKLTNQSTTTTTIATTKITKPTTPIRKPIPKPILTPKVNPPLVILEHPTTVQIVEKIIPPSPKNSSSKITFVKPKAPPVTKKTIHDDLAVPTKAGNNDEELLLTSPLPKEDINNEISLQEKEYDVEKISDTDPEHMRETKTDFRQTQQETSNVTSTFVVIGIVFSMCLVGTFVGVALLKCRFVRCRNKRMLSGQGDSQSDVRFLTADEVLDFNLDKDYDEL